jgi:porphobilinogen deaminase
LAALAGTCHSPVAAHAFFSDDKLVLTAEILSENGQERQSGEVPNLLPGDTNRPAQLASALLAKASDGLRALFTP